MALRLAAPLFAASLLAVPAFAASHEPDLSGVSSAVDAAVAAGLEDAIAATDGMTVFVPSNDAIAGGPQDAISDLLADPGQLSAVVTYYAVPGKVMAADAVALAEGGPATVQTVNGADLTIMVEDGNVMIQGATGATATVVTPDVEIGNVVVHVIDGLVLPAAP